MGIFSRAGKKSQPAKSQLTPAVQKQVRIHKNGGIRGMAQSIWSIFQKGQNYYQASTTSPKMRYPLDFGPNGANSEHPILRSRSRYAKANYGWYRQLMNQLSNNIVSYGINPIIRHQDLKQLWKIWWTEAHNRGHLDFGGIQWHTVNTVGTDGECLLELLSVDPSKMLSGVPLKIRMMTADYLPIGWTRNSPDGNWIIDGVERNENDDVVNYWLYPKNPINWTGTTINLVPRPVSADNILHIFWPETVESERGAPWASSILNAMEMLRDYQHSEVEKKALQSKFTVVYTKPPGTLLDNDEYSGSEDDEEPTFAALPPGAAVEAPEGYEPKLVDMPQNDANYGDFNRFTLSEVAVSVGLCVEQITLNFKDVNDRVYRAMMLEVARFVQSIQYHMMIAQCLAPIWKRFVSAAILAGAWTPPPGAKPSDYLLVEWMPPARGHIHPIQEVQAFMAAVQAGFTSRSKVAAEYGYDIEEIDLENASDSQRAQIEGIAYTVYDGWKDQNVTPEMIEIRKQQQKAVMDALQKMAEEDMTIQ